MSFSADVKEELSEQFGHKQHCLIAEAGAIFAACGQILEMDGSRVAVLQTENEAVARKYYNLLKKAMGIRPAAGLENTPGKKRKGTYVLTLTGDECRTVLESFCMVDKQGRIGYSGGV